MSAEADENYVNVTIIMHFVTRYETKKRGINHMPIFILSCIALLVVIILVIIKRKTFKNWQIGLLSVIATLFGIVITLGLVMMFQDDSSRSTALQTNTLRVKERSIVTYYTCTDKPPAV
jgi:predicted RND superfamily exporter protein